MIVSAIVAVGDSQVIGKYGDLPWHLPADLKYFKRKTLNHHIIMGRKTFQSIGRPLPKRTNIVVTRNPYFIASSCLIASSLEEALRIAHDNGEEEVFVIGGAELYRVALPYVDRLYWTKVEVSVEGGDAFFPDINFEEFALEYEEYHKADEKNPYDYAFQIYARK